MNTPNRTFATIISYLFHPIWIPGLTTFYLIQLFSNQMIDEVNDLLMMITLLFTLALPLFSSILLKTTGVISSLKMPTASERRIPLFLSFSFFLIMTHLFNAIHIIPFDFTLIAFGASLSVLVALLALPFSKISIHTLSIGSVWGAIFSISQSYQADLFYVLLLLSLLAGIIGHARISLNAHSHKQVYLGFLVGVLFQILSFLFQNSVYQILNFRLF